MKPPPFWKQILCPWVKAGLCTAPCWSHWCRVAFSPIPPWETSSVDESPALLLGVSWRALSTGNFPGCRYIEASEYTFNVSFGLCYGHAPVGCRQHDMVPYFSYFPVNRMTPLVLCRWELSVNKWVSHSKAVVSRGEIEPGNDSSLLEQFCNLEPSFCLANLVCVLACNLQGFFFSRFIFIFNYISLGRYMHMSAGTYLQRPEESDWSHGVPGWYGCCEPNVSLLEEEQVLLPSSHLSYSF